MFFVFAQKYIDDAKSSGRKYSTRFHQETHDRPHIYLGPNGVYQYQWGKASVYTSRPTIIDGSAPGASQCKPTQCVFQAYSGSVDEACQRLNHRRLREVIRGRSVIPI